MNIKETKEGLFKLLDEQLANYIMDLTFTHTPVPEMGMGLSTGDLIEDFRWLTTLKNLGNITDKKSKDALYHFLISDKYIESRWDFIYKTTALIKLELGPQQWNNLIQDVAGALKMTDGDKKHGSAMSTVNTSNLEPSVHTLSSDHWLVTVILYGLSPSTSATLNSIITQYAEMVAEKNKAPGNRVMR